MAIDPHFTIFVGFCLKKKSYFKLKTITIDSRFPKKKEEKKKKKKKKKNYEE